MSFCTHFSRRTSSGDPRTCSPMPQTAYGTRIRTGSAAIVCIGAILLAHLHLRRKPRIKDYEGDSGRHPHMAGSSSKIAPMHTIAAPPETRQMPPVRSPELLMRSRARTCRATHFSRASKRRSSSRSGEKCGSPCARRTDLRRGNPCKYIRKRPRMRGSWAEKVSTAHQLLVSRCRSVAGTRLSSSGPLAHLRRNHKGFRSVGILGKVIAHRSQASAGPGRPCRCACGGRPEALESPGGAYRLSASCPRSRVRRGSTRLV